MSKLALLVVTCLLAAGCTGSGSTNTATLSSGPATGSVAAGGNDTLSGTLVGTVQDEEMRPVPNAVVALIGVGVEVKTTDAGAFEIQNVPIGRQVLTVAALGYESQSKAVDVVVDERTQVTFILSGIAIIEPRYVSLPHTFFIHLGFYGTSFAGGNTTSCESCEWIPKIEKNPTHAIIEIKGKHTVPYPTRPDGLAVFLYKNKSTSYFSGCNWIAADNDPPCIRLPMRREFNHTELIDAVPAEAEVQEIRFWQWCDPFWFCVEERYDEWFTVFYDTEEAAIPKGFTAWPN